MSDYQLVVIGAGPAGCAAALRAAELGLRCAVVESRACGGTCLNRGCVPTKALLHASGIYRAAVHAERMGVLAKNVRVDAGALCAYQDSVVRQLRGNTEALLERAGVALVFGRGTIVAPGRVRVDCANAGGDADAGQPVCGEACVRELTTENILVATGAVPARPPIPGLDLAGVLTSDDLLAGLPLTCAGPGAGAPPFLPPSVVVIGGGVVGVEFATFFSDLGGKVTVLEGLDRLLPSMDRDLGRGLAQILKRRGASVHVGAVVERIEQGEDGLSVFFSQKGELFRAEGALVLCAVGRLPNTDGLFAHGLQVAMDGPRIRVDEGYRTSVEGVYAVGDVSSPVQLAHVAAAQGAACAELVALGAQGAGSVVSARGLAMDVVPSCVYCRPEIASVGMTEAEAKAAGVPVRTGKCALFSNARTVIAGADRSFMKVVAHAETGAVLGAQLMCENATDMISQLSAAVAHSLTVRQLLAVMRPHPTYEETLACALGDLAAKCGG